MKPKRFGSDAQLPLTLAQSRSRNDSVERQTEGFGNSETEAFEVKTSLGFHRSVWMSNVLVPLTLALSPGRGD